MTSGRSLTEVRVFVASPGDVADERKRLDDVIDGLRRGLASKLRLTIRLLRWEDVPPDMGRPQGLIMDELAAEPFDIFVGVLWNRFGTPSGGRDASGRPFASGTQEEFEHALALRAAGGGTWPAIMIYRRVEPVDPTTLDLQQLALVNAFFESFEPDGAHPGLAKQYDSVDVFADRVRADLEHHLWRYAEAAQLIPDHVAVPAHPVRHVPAGVSRTQLLIDYLDAVIRDTDELHPGGIRQVKFDLALKLDSVYVSLRAERNVPDVDQRLLQEDLDELRERLGAMERHERDQQAEIWARDMRSLERAVQSSSGDAEEVAKVVDLHRRVVLLGDPGGGKTTLLHWLALNFARAIRAEPERILEPQPWWTPTDRIWAVPDLGPVRVPIYLRIARYAEARDTSQGGNRTLSLVEFLPRYLAGLQIPHAAAVADLLVDLLNEGRCFLLLDGLDEITDYADRRDITENVVRFAGAFAEKGVPGWLRSTVEPVGGAPVDPAMVSTSPREHDVDVSAVLGDPELPADLRAQWHDRLTRLRDGRSVRRVAALDEIRRHLGNHFLVTSRRAGYQLAPVTGGFEVFSLREMSEPDIERFLRRWCRAVEYRAAVDEPDMARIEERAQQEIAGILRSVESSPGVRRLARNPLLLRILAVIHRNERHLPRKRAELYDTATVTLLRDWQLNKGNKAGALDEMRVTSLLGPVAFWMHENRASAHIERLQALRLMASVLAAERGADPDRPPVEIRQQVEEFLESVRLNSGLFIERGEGLYGFMHLTFEEYFTARQMISDPLQAKDKILARLHEPRWREPILLAFGLMSRTFFQGVDDLLRAVLAAGSDYESVLARDLIFAATCVSDSAISSHVLRREIAEQLIARHMDRDGAGRYRVLREQIEVALSALQQEGADDAVDLALEAAVRAAHGRAALSAAFHLVDALRPRGVGVAEALEAVTDTSKAARAYLLAQEIRGRVAQGWSTPAKRDAPLHRLVGAMLWHDDWSYFLFDVLSRTAADTELGPPNSGAIASMSDLTDDLNELFAPLKRVNLLAAVLELLRLAEGPQEGNDGDALTDAAREVYFLAPARSELRKSAHVLWRKDHASTAADLVGRIAATVEALRREASDVDRFAALEAVGQRILRDTAADHVLLSLIRTVADDLPDAASSDAGIVAAQERIVADLRALLETTGDGVRYHEAARMLLRIEGETGDPAGDGAAVESILLAHVIAPGERSVWALQVLAGAEPSQVSIPSEVADRLRTSVVNGDRDGDLMLDVLFGEKLDGPLLDMCWAVIAEAEHPHHTSAVGHLRAVTALAIDDAVMSALRDGYDRPACRQLVVNLLLSADAIRGDDVSPLLAWLLSDVPIIRHRAALLLASRHAGDPTRPLRMLLLDASGEPVPGTGSISASVRRLIRALWVSGSEALPALAFVGASNQRYLAGSPIAGTSRRPGYDWPSSAIVADAVIGHGSSPQRCPELIARAAERLDSISPGVDEPSMAAVTEVTERLADRLAESMSSLGLAPLGALRTAVGSGMVGGWCRAVLRGYGVDPGTAALWSARRLPTAPDELRAAIAATLLAADVQLHLVRVMAEALNSEFEQIRVAAGRAISVVAAALPTDGSTDAVEFLHQALWGATGAKATHVADALQALNYSSPYWPRKWSADLRNESTDAHAKERARIALQYLTRPSDPIRADLASRLIEGERVSEADFEAATVALRSGARALRRNAELHRAVLRALEAPTATIAAARLARFLEGKDAVAVAVRLVELIPAADDRMRHAMYDACQGILRYVRRKRSDPLTYEAVVAAARVVVRADITDAEAVRLLADALWIDQPVGDEGRPPSPAAQLVDVARHEWLLRRALRDSTAGLGRIRRLLLDELHTAPAEFRGAAAACLALVDPSDDRISVLGALLHDDRLMLDVLLDMAGAEDDLLNDAAIAAWVTGRGPDRAAQLIAWSLDALIAPRPLESANRRRHGLTSLLAELSDLTTPTTFFRRYDADAAVAVLARVVRYSNWWRSRLQAVRCLGNLQRFTDVTANAFFLACQDVDAVFDEAQAAVTKFKYFGSGSLEVLTAAVRSPNVTVAANAARLLGQLGLARSEELGRDGRRRVADELVSILDDPSLTRRSFERGTGRQAGKEGEPLYELVFATLLQVVSGEDPRPESGPSSAR